MHTFRNLKILICAFLYFFSFFLVGCVHFQQNVTMEVPVVTQLPVVI